MNLLFLSIVSAICFFPLVGMDPDGFFTHPKIEYFATKAYYASEESKPKQDDEKKSQVRHKRQVNEYQEAEPTDNVELIIEKRKREL